MIKINQSVGEDGRVCISIAGEADIFTAPDMKEKINSSVEKTEHHLCIDLTELEYIDSTGLGLLVGALKRMRNKDGKVSLVRPQPQIRKLLDITGLSKVFDIKEGCEC